MSIIAVLLGGLFGSFSALIALFGIGVDWSTGFAVYFATATLVALPIIGLGTLNRHKIKTSPSFAEWERELRDYQPGPLVPAPLTGDGDAGQSARKIA